MQMSYQVKKRLYVVWNISGKAAALWVLVRMALYYRILRDHVVHWYHVGEQPSFFVRLFSSSGDFTVYFYLLMFFIVFGVWIGWFLLKKRRVWLELLYLAAVLLVLAGFVGSA